MLGINFAQGFDDELSGEKEFVNDQSMISNGKEAFKL
jgi:hypothetical protein